MPEPGEAFSGKVKINKLQSLSVIEAELSARKLLVVPRDTIDRTDARWKSCKELREMLPTVTADDGTVYLKDGLMGDPTWTYDESAVVYTADSPAAMCAIM